MGEAHRDPLIFFPALGLQVGITCLAICVGSEDTTQDIKFGEYFADWAIIQAMIPFLKSSKVKIKEVVLTHKSEERRGECES